MQQDRDAGGHLQQPHDREGPEQQRPVAGLGARARVQALLARLHVVSQVGPVVAVRGRHDARRVRIGPKLPDSGGL